MIKRHSKVGKQQGFTILEVLIAMAILAIAGTAVVRAAGEHMTAIDTLKQVTFTSWVAENRLVEIQLETKWPPSNNKKGKMEMAGTEWFWQQKVEKVDDKNMRKVTVMVMASEDDKEPVYQLSTYIGNPNE
jgi:general secretion pathway protein I